jgi:DNA-binding protein
MSRKTKKKKDEKEEIPELLIGRRSPTDYVVNMQTLLVEHKQVLCKARGMRISTLIFALSFLQKIMPKVKFEFNVGLTKTKMKKRVRQDRQKQPLPLKGAKKLDEQVTFFEIERDITDLTVLVSI